MSKHKPDAKMPMLRVAILLPEDVRENPESPFLRLFRDNAAAFRKRFQFLCTSGTAAALDRTRFYSIGPNIQRFSRGSQGGIVEIANEVVTGGCSAVVFLYDPETLHSESPEARALVRQCIDKEIPLLNSVETAAFWLKEDFQVVMDSAGAAMQSRTLPHVANPHVGSIRAAEVLETCTLALVAHDKKKSEMRAFVKEFYAPFLSRFGRILMTETTGFQIEGSLRKSGEQVPESQFVHVESGPRGGDIQIANEVIRGHCQCVIFFQDQTASHAHDADISLLRRACQAPESACVFLSDVRSARRWVTGRLAMSAGSTNRATARIAPHMTRYSPAGYLRRKFNLAEVIVNESMEIQELNSKYQSLLRSSQSDEGWLANQAARRYDEIAAAAAVDMAAYAAPYLESLLRAPAANVCTIAVMHGQTLARFIDHLGALGARLEGARVIAGCTAIGLNRHDAPELAEKLAGIVHKDGDRRDFHPAQDLSTSVPDIILTSIMPLPSSTNLLKRLRPIAQATDNVKKIFRQAVEKKAVGVVGGMFIDETGADVCVDVPSEWSSLSHHQFQAVARDSSSGVPSMHRRRSILLTTLDVRRYRAIAAMIIGGLINVLITDQGTLENVTEILDGGCAA